MYIQLFESANTSKNIQTEMTVMDCLLCGSSFVFGYEVVHPIKQHSVRGLVGGHGEQHRPAVDGLVRRGRGRDLVAHNLCHDPTQVDGVDADAVRVEVRVALLAKGHEVSQLIHIHQIKSQQRISTTSNCLHLLVCLDLIHVSGFHSKTVNTNKSTTQAGIPIFCFADLRLIRIARHDA